MSIDRDNIKTIIIGSLALVAVVFSAMFIFGGDKKKNDPDQSAIPIEATSNTYESKLQAYKDKRKKEKEEAYKRGYDPNMNIVQPDPETIQEDVQVSNIQESIQARPERQASPGPSSRSPGKPAAVPAEKRQAAQTIAINNLQNALKTENQAEDRGMSPAPATTQAPAQPQNGSADEKERRRKAMQTWNKQDNATATGKTYQAVIHKEQVVSNGKMAAFRTKEDIDTGNLTIPANTLLFGTVSVTQNRLIVNISSVTINKNVYPIKLSVYGTDGAPGIPVQIDNVQKAADSKIGDEIVSATRKRTGVIGDVVGGIANAMKREKEISCTLIDNQTIYLKLN